MKSRFITGAVDMKKLWKKLWPGKSAATCSTILSNSLERNLRILKEDVFRDDDTIIYREFATEHPRPRRCVLVSADGMTDHVFLSDYVIQAVMYTPIPPRLVGEELVDFLIKTVIVGDEVKADQYISGIVDAILDGDGVLLVEGCAQGIIINSRGWPKRTITEPASESVVRGPREGFTEALTVNISLIRRRINTPMLKFQYLYLGEQTQTKVAITYIEGVASPAIVQEVLKRVDEIEIDGIIESGYIEELIRDSPLCPFKTVGHTERPDVVAAKMLEGRVAILVDGTPFVLTVPYIFVEAFQANEDYYKHFAIASVDRLIRYFCFFITTSTPAIYLSLITYHHQLIPTELILSISAARKGVPFPAVVEIFTMGLLFEILREGGIRLPRPIGQALSIVGAIVLGDAAVSAQLVSAPMIIVVATTGIAGFAVPQLYGAAILTRLILALLSSVLGLYGFFFGVIGLFIQLSSMRSFGVPYLSSMQSDEFQEVKDTAIRSPWWVMRLRPPWIGKKNPIRMRNDS